ncbi:MAG: FoF1 ATP synthase subunit gamma [bacterium]|nr:FoF1 ATP synthase subunit gamma [bacterium]
MAVNGKTIKGRIKSITSTKKITKAMEMISAVKMRRAVANVLATRSYAGMAWQMLLDIAKNTDVTLHPLLAKREVKKIGLIFVTSNRGMAGGFSSKLLTDAHNFIQNKTASVVIPTESRDERRNPLESTRRDSSTEFTLSERSESNGLGMTKQNVVDIILLGKRGRKIFTYYHHDITAEYEKFDITTKMEEILPMARTTIQDYLDNKYDEIWVAYTDYASALKQNPTIKRILPLQDDNELVAARSLPLGEGETKRGSDVVVEFLFEPTPESVLNILLPRLVEMQIYQAILESDASEHSARMLAMANASDAATDIIKELNYTYNKARQSAITQEIAEIVGGAAALE